MVSSPLRSRLARLVALTLVLLIAAPASSYGWGRDRTAPTTPSQLRITASSAYSVSLAWNPSTDNGTFWYIVDGAGSLRVDPPQTTLTRSQLMPNRTYSLTVYAVDAAGNRSAHSNAVTFTTPPDTTAPSPAPELRVVDVHPARVRLGWATSRDDTSPQVFHRLDRDGAVFRDVSFRTSYLVHDVAPGSTHSYRVTVRDQVGNAVGSNTVTVTTPPATDVTAPSAPTGLRETTGGCEEAWLTWSASTDDTDPAALLRYDVYVNGVRQPVDSHSPIGHTSTVAYAATPGLNTFAIRAADTSGNVSAPSNAFTCTL